MKELLGSREVHPKFTVIITAKHHHIRFFPANSQHDKNSNPVPRTLVERDITHPFHWDFYLCSHIAIQGAARPVHYHVILDEANCKPDELQRIIYEQCYMPIRRPRCRCIRLCTTPTWLIAERVLKVSCLREGARGRYQKL